MPVGDQPLTLGQRTNIHSNPQLSPQAIFAITKGINMNTYIIEKLHRIALIAQMKWLLAKSMKSLTEYEQTGSELDRKAYSNYFDEAKQVADDLHSFNERTLVELKKKIYSKRKYPEGALKEKIMAKRNSVPVATLCNSQTCGEAATKD